jgi:hypothetical protein
LVVGSAFAVWGRLAENPWMTSVREVVAGVIDLPPSDPEAPGPFRYAEADKGSLCSIAPVMVISM